jgi:spermidine synthase
VHRIVFVFFFLSGFSSLVFEILWERMLMQVFGSTTFAISTLLTAFMAGLALGSALGGRVAARLERPLLVYGLLEGAIGLYALAVPAALGALPSVYGAIFTTFLEDFYLFSLLRFVAVFLLLLLPTTMMGASLPIVSQWVARHSSRFQGSVGLLYGVNTFGACAGTLLAGFVLLPRLGLSTTNLAFAAINVALCAVVVVCALGPMRRLDAREPGELERERELDALAGRIVPLDPLPSWARPLTLGVFALSGALSMTYQVLWTRAYVIVLGSSTYSFTVVLSAFLTGLATGSALTSALVGRLRRPLAWLAGAQLGLCASATVAFFVLDDLPRVLFHRMREAIFSPNDIYLFNFGLVALVVLVPTLLQGASFPLVVRALVGEREDAGREVGRVYSSNTLGSIAGSFAAGFILLPNLGLSQAIALAVGLNLLGALLVAGADLRAGGEGLRRRVAALSVGALVAGSALAFAPPIDRVALTRGLFRAYWSRELFDAEKLDRDAPELLFYEDGVAVTTSVERRGSTVTLKGNGKAEASDGADMSTQILVGLLPFVFHSARDPDGPIGGERALMIGYGSGVTSGGALQWPLATLDVIEIEEAMIEASRFFDHVNHTPLDDPRHHLVISDGRNYLEYVDTTYDVIVSEPSNPWIAGVSAMFTVEHFRRARRRLATGGVFGQWVQLYEMSPTNVAVIFNSFAQAFPHVQVFSSMPKGTDLILIGSDAPIPMPADAFARAWANPVTRAELERAGLRDMYDLYGLMFMNQHEFLEFAQGAPLNTDDNGYLEFEAPKDLIRYKSNQDFFKERYHGEATYGDARPVLDGWGTPAWGPERVGALARGNWRAGKLALASAILDDAGFPTPASLPGGLSEPYGALEQAALARHARDLDLDELFWRTWPAPDHELAPTVVDAARRDLQTQAMQYVESQGAPGRLGYPGLKGLLYGYLLTSRRYHRLALKQLTRLRDDAQAPDASAEARLVTSSPAFWATYGHVLAKRLKYADSFDAYVQAARLLVDTE